VLIFDEYRAHRAAAIVRAPSNLVHYFEIVAGTTSVCQPNDLALFRSLKVKVRRELLKHHPLHWQSASKKREFMSSAIVDACKEFDSKENLRTSLARSYDTSGLLFCMSSKATFELQLPWDAQRHALITAAQVNERIQQKLQKICALSPPFSRHITTDDAGPFSAAAAGDDEEVELVGSSSEED